MFWIGASSAVPAQQCAAASSSSPPVRGARLLQAGDVVTVRTSGQQGGRAPTRSFVPFSPGPPRPSGLIRSSIPCFSGGFSLAYFFLKLVLAPFQTHYPLRGPTPAEWVRWCAARSLRGPSAAAHPDHQCKPSVLHQSAHGPQLEVSAPSGHGPRQFPGR